MSVREDVLQFLREPAAFAAEVDDEPIWLSGLEDFALPSIAATGDRPLREAQEAAWRGLATNRAGLVLGPPGTGKTHLLSWMIAAHGPARIGGMLLAGGLVELAVGWTARHSVVGKVAFGSGTMTVIAGLFFMGAVSMGLPQLTVLTIVWLAVRGLISAVLAFNWRSSRAARTLLLVRGGADLALSIALVAGVSVAQIAFILFGGTPAMVIGFLVIVAVSFGVAGVGLVAIAIAERAWEQKHLALTEPGS